MNRVVVVFDARGHIAEIAADAPVRVLFVDQGVARNRVFEVGKVQVGREQVDRHVRGLPIAPWEHDE
ncbi:MAG: hypothetical protein NVV74_15895 [Magnetospirillum sp.]|nr:hypothetical protein [Magnetospirillum sp.]